MNNSHLPPPPNPDSTALGIAARGVSYVFRRAFRSVGRAFLLFLPFIPLGYIGILNDSLLLDQLPIVYGLAMSLGITVSGVRDGEIAPPGQSALPAYLAVALVALPVSLAAGIAAVLFGPLLLVIIPIYLLVRLLTRSATGFGRALLSSTPTIERGASSHYNADGRPKAVYSDSSGANAAAAEYQRDFPGHRMNSYRCSSCSGWHIGHSH